MNTKITPVAGLAALAALGLAVMTYGSRDSQQAATPAAETAPPQAAATTTSPEPAEVGIATDVTPEEAAELRALERWLDQGIADGQINPDLLDYAIMDTDDPAFQERFFVLARTGEIEASRCDRIETDPDTQLCWHDYDYHPHFAYDVETLRQMAETDAVAAAVLGLKLALRDPDASLYYRLHAAQLSGKPGPLLSYLNTSSAYLDESYSRLLNPEEVLQHYAVALVVDAMGYPFMQAPEVKARLNRYGVPQELQEQAAADSEQMLANLGGAQ